MHQICMQDSQALLFMSERLRRDPEFIKLMALEYQAVFE
jgi:hypothetical protein